MEYAFAMQFKRIQTIEASLAPKRVLMVYGPRRVGKTTLLKQYLSTQSNKRVFYVTGDDIAIRRLFESQERRQILDFARLYDVIGIDEAQSIPSIGLGAKMIIDEFPDKVIILTGSSSFELAQEIVSPLTGRHFTLTLLPLAQSEISSSQFELTSHLEDFLLYGAYPEVLNEPDPAKKIRILNELVSSYLFKDVLALEKIKSPDTLLDITKCLAFQVGSEVSVSEIATIVKADVKKVGRYLDILEKMFVIKRVRGFSRNLRNEIAKKAKYYFLDNGVRNAIIGAFNPLDLRNDIGALWENFVFTEMLKRGGILVEGGELYFWRTHGGQEIDIIKEVGGRLEAVECKWTNKKVIAPKLWTTTYPDATFAVVSKDNYLEYLL